ncbi:MAG: carboxypeptidase-like regulatory domain-containing protein [Muriicola sp.]
MFPIRSCAACVFFFFGILQFGYGQRDYKGIILDKDTNEPIPFVNIGFPKKGVGTVSDEQGFFHLEFEANQFNPTDILQFSSLGYGTINKTVSELNFSYNEYPKIYMVPEAEQLKEVVVTDAGLFEYKDPIGYKNGGHQFYGYWKDNVALGGELATKIRIKKGLRKLDEFTFEVLGNTSDSVLVRINFYNTDGNDGFPGTNINTSGKNVLHTIKSAPGVSRVNLSAYDLFVRDDFIVSLELLKVYGKSKIGLVLAAANNRFTDSFKKYSSQDKWGIMNDVAMAYRLESTMYSKKQKKVSKRTPKKAVTSSISGYVFHGNIALSEVKVINLSKGVTVNTNEKGNYEIEADEGDMLQFVAQGMKKLTVVILKKKFINIRLERS